jgi:hypothetical protein
MILSVVAKYHYSINSHSKCISKVHVRKKEKTKINLYLQGLNQNGQDNSPPNSPSTKWQAYNILSFDNRKFLYVYENAKGHKVSTENKSSY